MSAARIVNVIEVVVLAALVGGLPGLRLGRYIAKIRAELAERRRSGPPK